MNRSRKFVVNMFSTLLMQLIKLLSGFVVPKIVLLYYGSEVNGLTSSLKQLIQYFLIVEGGVGAATICMLYKPLAEKNEEAINKILSVAKRLYTKGGYIFFSLILGLACLYPIFIHTASMGILSVFALVLILSFEVSFSFFVLAKYTVLLQADQRFFVQSLAFIIYILGEVFIVWAMANRGADIVFTRLMVLPLVFLRGLSLILYCRSMYRFLDFDLPTNVCILNKRWEVLFQRCVLFSMTGAPIFILTVISKDLKVVSVYSVYNLIFIGIGYLLSVFDGTLFASFGDVIARRETKVLKKAYGEFEFFYYGLLTVIYAVAFVTVMSFIRIYTRGVNDANYDVPLIGFLFILNGLLSGIKIPQNMLVTAAGMFRETRWQTATQGIIVVAGGVLLAPRWGIEGVLTASILSNLYRCVDLVLFVPKHITGLPVRVTLFRLMRVALATLLIVAPFFWIPVEPQSFAQWFIVAGSITVYAVIVFFLFALLFDRQEMMCVMRRLAGVFGGH